MLKSLAVARSTQAQDLLLQGSLFPFPGCSALAEAWAPAIPRVRAKILQRRQLDRRETTSLELVAPCKRLCDSRSMPEPR
jgi:hypothetical protein